MTSIKSRSKSNDDEYLASKLESIKTVPSLSNIFFSSPSFLIFSGVLSLLFQGKIFWILSRNPGEVVEDLPAESVIKELPIIGQFKFYFIKKIQLN